LSYSFTTWGLGISGPRVGLSKYEPRKKSYYGINAILQLAIILSRLFVDPFLPFVSLGLGGKNTRFFIAGLFEEVFETFICFRCPAAV
jgi:hypothetical protein